MKVKLVKGVRGREQKGKENGQFAMVSVRQIPRRKNRIKSLPDR